ncbi:MAG: PEGA domain-containing protein [Kiritimatiellia bacterium]
MRRTLVTTLTILTLGLLGVSAAPLRVTVLDFEDTTGSKPDPALGGTINTGLLAKKAADLLCKVLVARKEFVLIDRRDFVAKLERSTPRELAEGLPRPGFIQAAQLLGADAVLGGNLTSFSTSRETVNLGGYKTDLVKLAMRVTVKALDAVDGSVIALTDGSAEESFRQTDAVKTSIGEEDVLKLMEQALAKTIPQIAEALANRQAAPPRAKVTINVDTTANPSLVEIDGVLVGTTPLTELAVYQGEHTIKVSRPGYETMTKRLVLDKNLQISVPMFRTDLSAEEKKALLEKAEMKIYLFNGKPDILIQELKQ